jgi:chromosome segregation ATPase
MLSDVTTSFIKAETAESNLVHTVTDYPSKRRTPMDEQEAVDNKKEEKEEGCSTAKKGDEPEEKEGEVEKGKHHLESRIDALEKAIEKMAHSEVGKGGSMTSTEPEQKTKQNEEPVKKAEEPVVTAPDTETIVKAKVDEITKAFNVQIDELRKANEAQLTQLTELKKAHDTLQETITKMESEVIKKGGSIVVIPEQLGKNDPLFGAVDNATAIAKMRENGGR